MHALLARVLDAHGGLDHWNSYQRVDATIVSGGGLFSLKGVPRDASLRRMTVWLHVERASVVHAFGQIAQGAHVRRMHDTQQRIVGDV